MPEAPGAAPAIPLTTPASEADPQADISGHPLMVDTVEELPLDVEITKDGILHRLPNGWSVVMSKGRHPSVMDHEGVECLNPDAEKGDRMYRKVFRNLTIYQADEFEEAMTAVFGDDPRRFILAANGFSRLEPGHLERWGVELGEYEDGVEELMRETALCIRQRFGDTVPLGCVDGGADKGVDKSVINVEKEMDLPALTTTSYGWLMYAEDAPGRVVYATPTKQEYAVKFIEALDHLFFTGGRQQSMSDYVAAVERGKSTYVVDVLGALAEKEVDSRELSHRDEAAFNAAAIILNRFGYASETERAEWPQPWEDVKARAVQRALEACAEHLNEGAHFSFQEIPVEHRDETRKIESEIIDAFWDARDEEWFKELEGQSFATGRTLLALNRHITTSVSIEEIADMDDEQLAALRPRAKKAVRCIKATSALDDFRQKLESR